MFRTIQIPAVAMVTRVKMSPAFEPKALDPPGPPKAPARPPPLPRWIRTRQIKKDRHQDQEQEIDQVGTQELNHESDPSRQDPSVTGTIHQDSRPTGSANKADESKRDVVRPPSHRAVTVRPAGDDGEEVNSALRLAPPTSAPSMSGQASNSTGVVRP